MSQRGEVVYAELWTGKEDLLSVPYVEAVVSVTAVGSNVAEPYKGYQY